MGTHPPYFVCPVGRARCPSCGAWIGESFPAAGISKGRLISKPLKISHGMTDKPAQAHHHPFSQKSRVRTMKVDITVIAEFPDGIPHDVIAKLARASRHPAASGKTTVSDEGIRVHKGRMPRRRMAWETNGIDLKHAISDEIFCARRQVAAKYGIELKRTVRRVDMDRATGIGVDQTVFWTWGEGDLMDLAPTPAK